MRGLKRKPRPPVFTVGELPTKLAPELIIRMDGANFISIGLPFHAPYRERYFAGRLALAQRIAIMLTQEGWHDTEA